jgi:hypothetical protein
MSQNNGVDMQKMTAFGVAFGMLLVAAVPMQAAHKPVHKHWKHTHVSKRVAPTAYAATNGYEVSGQKVCTYMGGPKSTLWSCR